MKYVRHLVPAGHSSLKLYVDSFNRRAGKPEVRLWLKALHGSDQIRVTCATANLGTNPGAIGLVQLHGLGVRSKLQQITNVLEWIPSRLRLVNLAGIDRGLAVLLRDDWAQLMPHGGPRIVQKLIDSLVEAGATYEARAPAGQFYPEARSDLEADMLATLAGAASPRAIDLLLAQPTLWRRWLQWQEPQEQEVLRRSEILDRLIHPPSVVVIGRPNVGKSTLTNAMAGRSASIVADLPGTTRDWVAGLAQLDGVAVRWVDTPGLRASDDASEQAAIDLAKQVIQRADVLIAMRDPSSDFPDRSTMHRTPDIYVVNKIDEHETDSISGCLAISAKTGRGVDRLQQRVLEVLGLANAIFEQVWAFSSTLRSGLRNVDTGRIRSYVDDEPRLSPVCP